MFNVQLNYFFSKFLLIVFFGQLLTQISLAQDLLLVSDIDDTIKRTGVRSSSAVINAPKTTNEFAGMSQLYSNWYKQNIEHGNIFYLTAAPEFIDHLGIDFLRDSFFPPDRALVADHVISGRGFTSGSESNPFPKLEDAGLFKKRKLIELYESYKEQKPNVVILIGDNGEKDILAYYGFTQYLAKQKSKTKVYTYIHHVYENLKNQIDLRSDQDEYLTSADLAVHFFNQDWISQNQLDIVLNEVVFDSIPSGDFTETLVPDFMECQKYDAWPKLKSKSPESQSTYTLIQSQMKKNCGSPNLN
jgi:hypothetical protein